MQNADDMVFDQRVENVTSDIHDNLRLCKVIYKTTM